MSVSAEFTMKLSVASTGTTVFGQTPQWSGEIGHLLSLSHGTTAGKFDLLYIGERTVASATNDDIDISGVLVAPHGGVVTAVELVGVVIVNKKKDGTANTTTLSLGGGSNPVVGFLSGTTPVVTNIGPGGTFVLVSPDASGLGAVTAGTGDILRIANSSGASAVYQIALLARTV